MGPVERADGLIETALKAGRTMDEIKSLIDMRNAEIARIAKLQYKEALSKFQELVPPVTRDKRVRYDHKDGEGETDYKYSTLGHTKRTITAAMAACGLSIDWKTRYDKDQIFVMAIVSHVGGHSESDELMGYADKSGGKAAIQAMKSTITYLRRSALESVLGLAPEDGFDDDGRGSFDPFKAEGKPKFTKAPGTTEFNQILTAFIGGKVTMEELTEKYTFTFDQLETLRSNEPAI